MKIKNVTRRFFQISNPYFYVAPALSIFCLFIIYPLFFQSYLCFFSWNLVSAKKFVGLENFIRVFTRSPEFYNALFHSLIFTLGTTVFQTSLGLVLAILVANVGRSRIVFQGIFYTPVTMSIIAVALIWTWMYNPAFGIINFVLERLGLKAFTHTWLGEPQTALYAIMVAAIWKWAGFTMVVYLAGMQSIPIELYEVAEIDGAGLFKRFWHITFPLLLPQTFINMFLTTIGSMKAFDWVFIMTAGGPGRSTEVLPTLIYENLFRFYRAGEASTMACFLFITIFVLALLLMRTFRTSF